MKNINRRSFLRTAAAASAGLAWSARSWAQATGANSDVRVAIVGLNGRGRQHLNMLHAIKGVRVVALCDVDTAVLARAMDQAKRIGANPETVVDFRDLLDRADVDAITIATPNHLHALQGVWAMQAGKDVLLEKPVSHNLWEGRQLVAAAAKYGRIAQAGTQSRSSPAIAEAIAWVRAGTIGRITAVRGLCYKRRATIGRTTEPVRPPETVNYDLWLGPAPTMPLRRARFHYDWHWQRAFGNGDIGNQGNHQMDVARRFLGDPEFAPRVFTVGGRFGYTDDGDTPNTQIAVYDYAEAPLIFEVRGLPAKPDALSGDEISSGSGSASAAEAAAASMDQYRGISVGNVIDCEGGYVVVPSRDYSSAQAFDKDGKLLREFTGIKSHYENFIAAVRSRQESDLTAPIRAGHVSSGLCHLANISYLAGRKLSQDELRERVAGSAPLAEAFGRTVEHLAVNGVDLTKPTATWGLPLTLDPRTEQFTGEGAAGANALQTREYRAPFVVPAVV